MTTTPSLPPQPWFDPKTGNAVEAFRRHYEALWQNAGKSNSTLSSNINSGVNQAKAQAAAAQATASSASQGVTDLSSTVADVVLVSGGGTPTTPPAPFSVAIDPFNAYGDRLGKGGVTTDAVIASVTGGTGPFTYAWAYVSGDTFTINSPTAATTTFFGSILVLGQSKYAVYRCTVTDTFDSTTSSATVGVSISELS